MTIAKLIEELKKFDSNLEVRIGYKGDEGCSTCGYGALSTDGDIESIIDLETRIVLSDHKEWDD